jgi:3-oxoacyl-[acyl-carrier-protein] synthase II
MTAAPSRSSEAVAITGLGAVSGWGWGQDRLWSGLRAGACAVGPPQRFDVKGHRTRLASEVPPPESIPDSLLSSWRHLSQADRFAVMAALEACRQGALTASEMAGAGVFFGSSTAAMAEGEEFYARLLGHRPGRPDLRLVASQQLNGPGDEVARWLQTSGPVSTVSSACAAAGLAIGSALRALRAGEVEVAVAGGADSLCQMTYAGFNSLRAVDEVPCRPFRVDRGGLNLGEGAGVLVLESVERARRRGAPILGLLAGAGASCDAHHMTAPHPEGSGAARAMIAALADAGREAAAISFVNTHGTGTPLNDSAEALALKAVFGPRAGRVPITSTKGAVGHLLGSSGGLEAVATVLCFHHGEIHPTPGEAPADPSLEVDLVLGQPRALAAGGLALSTSLAFGGANAALVIGGAGASP